jgi:hypothetical protein
MYGSGLSKFAANLIHRNPQAFLQKFGCQGISTPSKEIVLSMMLALASIYRSNGVRACH